MRYLGGKTADLLLEMRAEAKRAKVTIDDSETHVCVRDHVRLVRTWADSITLLNLQREKSLEKSYVDLTLIRGRSRFGAKGSAKAVSVEALYGEAGGIAILGRPGAGKTTTLQKIAQFALRDREKGKGGVPILVRFRDIRDGESLASHILGHLGVNVSVPATLSLKTKRDWDRRVLIRMLDQFSAILLLDGLDEADQTQRLEFEQDLRHIALSVETARLAITCRTPEYRAPLHNVQPYTLLPLNAKQVLEFAQRWLGKKEAPKFVAAVAKAPYAGTHVVPLMLAHLCALYERDRELPHRPIEVYEQIVSLLIEQWDRERGVRRGSRYTDLNWRGRERFLAAVAFELTMLRRRGSFDEDDLRSVYPKVAPIFGLPPAEADEVVEEIESHTGLVLKTGPNQFDFIHLSIQEYLSAMHARGLPDAIAPFFPEFPNELALVVAASPDVVDYLEKIVCKILEHVPVLKGHSFLPAFLSRLGLEQPALLPSAKLGWLLLALERLLSSGGKPATRVKEMAIVDFLPELPVGVAVALAQKESDRYPKDGFVELISKPHGHIPVCLRTALVDRRLGSLTVPSDLAG